MMSLLSPNIYHMVPIHDLVRFCRIEFKGYQKMARVHLWGSCQFLIDHLVPLLSYD